MPKGKPKKKYAGLYPGLGAASKMVASTAPQAVAHKRGGTHRVKDQDRTNTIYDTWDYKQLKAGAIDRGVYIKDMKKVQMAQALADFDRKTKRAEQEAAVERQRQQMRKEVEQRKERKRQHRIAVTKMKRKIRKEEMRQRDESVSDDTPDEGELQMMHNELLGFDEKGALETVGHVFDGDESWDSTSTESSVRSTTSVIHSSQLRLFEWQWPDVPLKSPAADDHPFGMHPPNLLERRPRWIHYVPLKAHTMNTGDKLFFPGQMYPPGIAPDFVPVLSQEVRSAARNGILQGTLRKATIERATSWAERTYVDGKNAHMFFFLPPPNENKVLRDVYEKWYLESRKLVHVRPTRDGEKAGRERRHMQRRINKTRRLVDVYDACQSRPPAMIYLPAYLDSSEDVAYGDREKDKSLQNLFYIRFPGCDVPHYYFWARKSGWQDPTVPNPNWDPMHIDVQEPRPEEPGIAIHPLSCSKTMIRIKNSNVPFLPYVDTLSSPVTKLIPEINRFLYNQGLAATLNHFRTKWTSEGKAYVWRDFGIQIPQIHPSGNVPTVPPMKSSSDRSVSMKIATIEAFGENASVDPYTGFEPWTTNDDAYWDVVEAGDQARIEVSPVGVGRELDPVGKTALYRRASLLDPSRTERNNATCAAWLQHVDGSFEPKPTNNHSGLYEEVESLINIDDKNIADITLPYEQRGMDVQCPFCLENLSDLTFRGQSTHMLLHSALRPILSQRRRRVNVPPVALSVRVRRPGCAISIPRSHLPYDVEHDADTERSSIKPRRKTGVHKRKDRGTHNWEGLSPSSAHHVSTECQYTSIEVLSI